MGSRKFKNDFCRKIKNGPPKRHASKAHISSDFQDLGCEKFFYQYRDLHFYYTQDLGTLEKMVYIAILVGQRPSYFIIPSFSDSCHSTALSPGKGLTCPSSIFLWSQEKNTNQAQDDADDLSGQQDVFIQQKAYSCQKKRYADICQERGYADFPASPV